MSRGLGYLQRYLFGLLKQNGTPMPFAEIRRIAKPHEVRYRPHMERSMRRTLAKMVAEDVLVVEGRGGPGDPYRYCVNPILLALSAAS